MSPALTLWLAVSLYLNGDKDSLDSMPAVKSFIDDRCEKGGNLEALELRRIAAHKCIVIMVESLSVVAESGKEGKDEG